MARWVDATFRRERAAAGSAGARWRRWQAMTYKALLKVVSLTALTCRLTKKKTISVVLEETTRDWNHAPQRQKKISTNHRLELWTSR